MRWRAFGRLSYTHKRLLTPAPVLYSVLFVAQPPLENTFPVEIATAFNGALDCDALADIALDTIARKQRSCVFANAALAARYLKCRPNRAGVAIRSTEAVVANVCFFTRAQNRIAVCCSRCRLSGGYIPHHTTAATRAASVVRSHPAAVCVVVEGVSTGWCFAPAVDGCHQFGEGWGSFSFTGAETFWFEPKPVEAELVRRARVPGCRSPLLRVGTPRCNCCGLRGWGQAPSPEVAVAGNRTPFRCAGLV